LKGLNDNTETVNESFALNTASLFLYRRRLYTSIIKMTSSRNDDHNCKLFILCKQKPGLIV